MGYSLKKCEAVLSDTEQKRLFALFLAFAESPKLNSEMYGRLAAEFGVSAGTLPPFFSKLWKKIRESDCVLDDEPSNNASILTKAATPKKTAKRKANYSPEKQKEKKPKRGKKINEDTIKAEEPSEDEAFVGGLTTGTAAGDEEY